MGGISFLLARGRLFNDASIIETVQYWGISYCLRNNNNYAHAKFYYKCTNLTIFKHSRKIYQMNQL